MERPASTISVLVVEDNEAEARLLKERLSNWQNTEFVITHVPRLRAALDSLREANADVVLLDLDLPDSDGLKGLEQLLGQPGCPPVVVLTGSSDERLALTAMQRGAQDYLLKDWAGPDTLARSLRYAIERYRLVAELRTASVTDELTGLQNRRGFLLLAERQLGISERTGKPLLVLLLDLDGLKDINDSFGHGEGDRALVDAAAVLKRTFRESDMMARWGGDEFVALLANPSNSGPAMLMARLQSELDSHNAGQGRLHALSLSVGWAAYEPSRARTIEELLLEADRLMYADKLRKGGRSRP